MSWNQRGNQAEQRVANPFGGSAPSQQNVFGQASSSGFGSGFGGSAPSQQNVFGQASSSGFGSFGQSGFGAFGQQTSNASQNPFQQPQRLNSGSFPSKGGKGKGKGKGGQIQSGGNSQMFDDIPSSPQSRVSNPFAAVGAAPKQAMSLQEAAQQYKAEFVKKKGYPFSCFGPPDERPVLTGDISPAELRWYLSQNNVDIQKVISERSSILNEDLSAFLRGAMADGAVPLSIKRAGPYRVPDPDFPSFVPKQPFIVVKQASSNLPSETDLDIFRSRNVPVGSAIPNLPPPLEYR